MDRGFFLLRSRRNGRDRGEDPSTAGRAPVQLVDNFRDAILNSVLVAQVEAVELGIGVSELRWNNTCGLSGGPEGALRVPEGSKS